MFHPLEEEGQPDIARQASRWEILFGESPLRGYGSVNCVLGASEPGLYVGVTDMHPRCLPSTG